MPAVAAPRIAFTIRWPIFVPIVIALLAAALAGGTGASSSHAAWQAGPAQTAPTGAGQPGLVSNDLARAAAQAPGREVVAIVQLRAGADASLVQASIAAAHGAVLRSVPLINGLAVRVNAAAAAHLADVAGVRAVALDSRVVGQGSLLDPSRLQSAYIQSVRADKAWGSGYTGKGVGVAVIDSGLAGNLPDFQSHASVSAVVNPSAADAGDDYGHGTHVAGLIAGNGFNRPATDSSYGHYAGVAPGANLVAVKADDGAGHTDVLSLIDGLQFVVSHAKQYNIRVVNLSVRENAANSYKTDPLDAAVEATWMHGIVVVAAAGNLGNASDAVSYAPGNDPYVITVGAVDDQGTKNTSDDQVASWSSHGTTQDGVAKPEVLAPGAHMVGPLAPGSYYASACASCLVDGGSYIRLGGTSMAAGVVSGAVADILQAHPDWTPDEVKSSLMWRGRDVGTSGGSGHIREIAVDQAINGAPGHWANRDLTPSNWIDPATGTIKSADESWAAGSWGASSWGASSWGASSWGAAPGQWSATWASDNYVGTSLDPNAFNPGNPQQCWQLLRTGFSASSWGASSWGSDEIAAAHDACDAAAKGQASSWGASSWGRASSWGASSWGASSWGASSWGASSWGASSWGASSWGASSWGSVDFAAGH